MKTEHDMIVTKFSGGLDHIMLSFHIRAIMPMAGELKLYIQQQQQKKKQQALLK